LRPSTRLDAIYCPHSAHQCIALVSLSPATPNFPLPRDITTPHHHRPGRGGEKAIPRAQSPPLPISARGARSPPVYLTPPAVIYQCGICGPRWHSPARLCAPPTPRCEAAACAPPLPNVPPRAPLLPRAPPHAPARPRMPPCAPAHPLAPRRAGTRGGAPPPPTLLRACAHTRPTAAPCAARRCNVPPTAAPCAARRCNVPPTAAPCAA